MARPGIRWEVRVENEEVHEVDEKVASLHEIVLVLQTLLLQHGGEGLLVNVVQRSLVHAEEGALAEGSLAGRSGPRAGRLGWRGSGAALDVRESGC